MGQRQRVVKRREEKVTEFDKTRAKTRFKDLHDDEKCERDFGT